MKTRGKYGQITKFQLAEKMFLGNIIKDVKGYLQDPMKPIHLTVEDYVTGLKPLMGTYLENRHDSPSSWRRK